MGNGYQQQVACAEPGVIEPLPLIFSSPFIKGDRGIFRCTKFML